MPHDISWDEYNSAQVGRVPRASLDAALDAAEQQDTADGASEGHRPPVAIDLGCGEGVEVSALLERGWIVHAVDAEAAPLQRLADRTPPALRDRLHIHQTPYADIDVLPEADLVHASYSLPYCEPVHFHRLWAAVRAALRPGAVLACQLFGPNDDSYGDPAMTFHSADEAAALFDGLDVVTWTEEDADGTAYTGPKHWHVFHVVARRPRP